MIIFFPIIAQAVDWKLPNTPSSGIGDMGSFYLADPSFFTLHVMNNDFIGNTDKLMTGSASLFYYKSLADYKSDQSTILRGLEFSLHRRLLTPILKTRFNTQELNQPEGFFADWLEVKVAYSQIVNRWKTELSLSLDDFGNFDGENIQAKIHKAIGSPDESSKYGKAYQGTYGAGSAGIGYFLGENLLVMTYFQKNEIMESWYLRTSYMEHFGKLGVGFQVNLVNQDYSDAYNEITQHRYDWGIGVKYGWWQANFGYFSKYLIKDDFGQFFINPLIIHFKF
jgi:hypothetical protein